MTLQSPSWVPTSQLLGISMGIMSSYSPLLGGSQLEVLPSLWSSSRTTATIYINKISFLLLVFTLYKNDQRDFFKKPNLDGCFRMA